MTLFEFFLQFSKQVSVEPELSITTHVAAEISAGHEIGLTPEQMHRFLARRNQITSVAVALKSPTVSVDAIERILEALRSGAIYPKDVLARSFTPEEVHEKFRSDVFGAKGA